MRRVVAVGTAAAIAMIGLAVPAFAAPAPDQTYTAVGDAFVKEAAPTTAEGAVDPTNCSVNDDTGNRMRCLVQFSVTGLGAGDTVTGAEFRIVDKGNATGTKLVNLNTQAQFNENTVTWTNMGTTGGTVASQSNHVFGQDSVFTIGSGVITGNGTYAFTMWSPANSYTTGMNFQPKENTVGKLPPRLVLHVDHQSSPVAAVSATPTSGDTPLAVTADASGSTDPDNDISTYTFAWGDGSANTGPQAGSSAAHIYNTAGSYTVTATVADAGGRTDSATSNTVVVTDPTPPPPPTNTAWGMNMNQSIGGSGQTWNQARAVYDSKYGDATHKPIQRSFISGMPSAGNWGNVAPTDRSAVVSFRTDDLAGVIAGNYDAQMTAFFQAVPATNTYWYSFYHEMEDNWTTAAQKAQYISAAQHVVTLQRSVANRSNLIPTEIYSDFTLATSSGRNWLDWYWGDSFVDVVAWDQYNYQNANGTLNTEATKQANRASVAASHSHNDEYAVAEFPLGGSKFEDPVTGGDTVRAQWLTDTAAAYANNGAVFVTGFDTNVGGTFAIESHPALVAAWKQVVTGGTGSPPPSQETRYTSYVTGYSYYDNTPPGSPDISNPVIHQTAAGVGTVANPITVAVGHSIINGQDILDFPAGTRFYIPNLRRYFIVEDTCGDGPTPQNGPCHNLSQADPGAQNWLDVWVDGRANTSAAADTCMNNITKNQLTIKNPASNYVVISGPIMSTTCTQQFGNTVVTT